MENNTYRRLTRSTTDRKLAGVCGGLAKHFNLDPSVVRIVFLVAALCGSTGVWIYLALWIIKK